MPGVGLAARLLIACFALAAAPSWAAGSAALELDRLGKPGARTRITQAPAPGSAVTLLQVLREVYPDLSSDGRATRFKGAHVLPDAVDADAGKGGPSSVDLAKSRGQSAYDVLEDGARHYLLISTEALVLIARVAPDYAFLDALFVQTDPGGPPAVTRAFMLAPGTPGLVVLNAHHNSQEGFASYAVLALLDGRLARVYDGPMLYSFANADGGCEPQRVTQRVSALDVLPKDGGGPADIDVLVEETRECLRAGKAAKPSGKVYAFRLTWDAKRSRYTGGSKALYQINRKRMKG